MRNAVGKAPKYRASCDACNEAKVRCSKTRPECARCLKHDNRRCVYSISKRSCKPRAEGSTGNGSLVKAPPTSAPTAEVGTPSSSSSTLNASASPHTFAGFTAQNADSVELSSAQHLHQDGVFENAFLGFNEPITFQGLSSSFDPHQHDMFQRDENLMANFQDHMPSFYDLGYGLSFVPEMDSYNPDDGLAEQQTDKASKTPLHFLH